MNAPNPTRAEVDTVLLLMEQREQPKKEKEPFALYVAGVSLWTLVVIACIPAAALAIILAAVIAPLAWLYSKITGKRLQ